MYTVTYSISYTNDYLGEDALRYKNFTASLKQKAKHGRIITFIV